MMRRTRWWFLVVTLAGVLSACQSSQVLRTLPTPDPARMVGGRTVDSLVRGFLGPGATAPWYARSEAPFKVVENGLPSEWQGFVIENRLVGVAARPCGPVGSFELYAWRERADSTSIDVLWSLIPDPRIGDPPQFGPRRKCWQSNLEPGPKLVRSVRSASGANHGRMAMGGTGQVSLVGPAPRQCRAQDLVPDSECPIAADVKIEAFLSDGADSVSAEHLIIDARSLPGLRRWRSCQGSGDFCSTASHQPIPPTGDVDPAIFAESDRYRTSWNGVLVHRTLLLVRFEDAVSEAEAARIGTSWDARPELRAPAGSVLFRFPDPGPAGFATLVAQVAQHSGVSAVHPVPAGHAVAGVLAGALEVVLDSGPPSGAYLCHGATTHPELAGDRLCRSFGASGRVVFAGLPVFDAVIFAVCPAGEGIMTAAAVRIEPRSTVTVRIPYQRCFGTPR